MRPAEYTNEQIIEAAQGLEAQGRRVTGFAIRQTLGGGAPARLKTVWDDYQQSQAVVNAEPVQELPVELQDTLENMLHEFAEHFKSMVLTINQKAVATSESRVATAIKTAQAEQEKAEAELIDATSTVEDLEKHLNAANTMIGEQKSDLDQSKATINALEKQLAVETEKNQALSSQQEKLTTERQDIIDTLSDVRQKLASQVAQTQALEKKMVVLEQENTSLASELEKEQARAEDLADQFRGERTNVAVLDARVRELETKLAVAQEQLKAEQIQRKTVEGFGADFRKLQAELLKIAKNKPA